METVEIGQSVRRREDHRFLTGAGRYVGDVNLDGQAYAGVLRSPHAHAVINGIDATEALALEGVLLVVTGADWQAAGYGSISTRSGVKTKIDGTPLNQPPRHCLAIDRVRYVGQEVALVVAETPALVLDAMELIDVDYGTLDAVTDAAAAAAEGAPQLWDDIAGNFCLDFELGDKDGVEKAFADADHVVTLHVVNNRVTSVPMEPRGAVADYDPGTDGFTLHNSSQNIHANRSAFAGDVLKIDAGKLHHVAPDVGGGFGAKNGIYGEPALLLHAARELKRPVKWIANRTEAFLADTHGRGQSSTVSLALDADGTFRALRTDSLGGIGAFCATVGPFTITGGSARTQGGPYRFPAMYYTGTGVFTNTMLMDPYRGAGRPEATYQTERIIEHAAREIGMDPVELRRKNLLRPDELPLKTSMNLDVDCGDFPHLFERTLEMSDRPGYEARIAASEAKGLRRGFAIAPYLECTGGGPKEHTGVTFNRDGTVQLATGAHSTGMGIETSLSQILAATLGLGLDDISFVQADTNATPIGGGHGGSRNMEVGGSSVLQAAEEIITKGRAVAAEAFGISVDQVEFADGRFFEASTNHTMTIHEVIEAAFDSNDADEGLEGGEGGNGLDTQTVYAREIISIPNGCHAAEVEVDPETGAINVDGYWVMDDFGIVINPMLADGQVMGGVAQGIGQALMENIVYDPDSGQLLSASLSDYALPRADTIPNMEIGYFEGAPTKKNPLGVKGSGEAGCVGALPAVVNAVLDALKNEGVRDLEMPLTPERVWRAIREKART
jgi:aerobic carbon-monoxide dehydrogenase large subunit